MTQLDYRTEYHQEGIGKPLTIKNSQRVDHILETNDELQKDLGQQAGKDFKLAARIPLAVINYWENNMGLDMSKVGGDPEMTAKFWKLLQSREYEKLRVWKGRMV